MTIHSYPLTTDHYPLTTIPKETLMSKNDKPRFFNSTKLTVRVGTEPESRTSTAGQLWTKVRVAVSMGKAEDGKTYKPSLWLTAKAFSRKGDDSLPNALAELAKGTLVTLSGRLAYEEYETRGGDKRADLSLLVNAIEPFENGAHAEPATATADGGDFDPPF
jgi:single-stranded DNA-binding protein